MAPKVEAVVAAQPMSRDDELLSGDDGFKEIRIGVSPLSSALCVLCGPLSLICGLYTVEPKKEAIIINAGVVTGIVTEEGCHWANPCLREIRSVSTAQKNVDIKQQRLLDLHGNPIIVSAVLTYRFFDPKRALLNVQSPHRYVTNACTAALKEVTGSYSYDELKTKSEEVSQRTVEILNPRVMTAGAVVQSVTLNTLVYAPEISQAMLRKQQAEQLISARALLVEGSTEIALKAVEALEDGGAGMTDSEKAKMVSDLIVISVGEGSGDAGNV